MARSAINPNSLLRAMFLPCAVVMMVMSAVMAEDSSVSAGLAHSCVLLSDETVKCFGHNNYGQLGTGDSANRGDGGSSSGEMGDDLPVVNLGRGAKAIGVAAGLTHSCALLDTGRVKCWGRNNWGQLGQGDYTGRGTNSTELGDNLAPIDLGTQGNGTSPLLATSMSVGDGFTCVLLEDGVVKCFGRNDEGQCGRGDLEESIGSSPDDLGDALIAVSLGDGVEAESISSGTSSTCAVLVGGGLKCWGSNAYGGLGMGDPYTRGDEESDMGDNLPEVDLGSDVVAERVFYGLRHVCAIVNDGMVKCWGDNRSGQLGLGHVETIGDDDDEMGDGLPFVNLDGVQATSLALGESHTCAILADRGGVKCWGKGFYGQLGNENYEAKGKYPGEMAAGLSTVNLGTDLTAVLLGTGSDHTCAVLDDGSLKCWGLNTSGALGLGDTNPRGDDSREMGDYLSAVSLGTGATVYTTYIPTESPTAVPTLPPTPQPTAAPTVVLTLPTLAPTPIVTPAPSPSLTPSPILQLTPSPTVSPQSAPPTLMPTVASVPETPMPTVLTRGGVLETPEPTTRVEVIQPTPVPTAAALAEEEGTDEEEVGTTRTGNDETIFSGENIVVTSITSTVAIVALVLVGCACRRRHRNRADSAVACVAAGESRDKSAGAGAAGAGAGAKSPQPPMGQGELDLGSGYSISRAIRVLPSRSADEIPSPVLYGTAAAGSASAAADDEDERESTSSSSSDVPFGGSMHSDYGGDIDSRQSPRGSVRSHHSHHRRRSSDMRPSSIRSRNSELTLARALSAGRPGYVPRAWSEHPSDLASSADNAAASGADASASSRSGTELL